MRYILKLQRLLPSTEASKLACSYLKHTLLAGKPEVPRGDSDLLAFYNLLRLYERLGKPSNYHKQLSDTSFSRRAAYLAIDRVCAAT